MRHNRKVEGLTERLNSAVYASGLTPGEIQKRAGVKRNTYYDHLSGQPMSELFIAKYCTALGISADWLLGLRKDNRKTEEETE